MRRALSAIVVTAVVGALVASAAGCSGAKTSGTGAQHLSVQIRLTTHASSTRSLSLTCGPASGTLPFAARVCGDISRHPRSMLEPGTPRSLCFGLLFGPKLTVTANANGKKTVFGGEPFCDWPGGAALGIYWAATQHDLKMLIGVEPRLRCDDNPVLLARPTPWASVNACVHGLWTPRSERLIRAAERAPAIAALRLARLFPREIGARRCSIPSGGPTRRWLHGTCGVYVRRVWSRPIVAFVEDWPRGRNSFARHIWRVTVIGGHAGPVAQTGPPPPQLWE